MDDAELVKYIDSLKLEDDGDSGEELCSLSYRCRIYSDSETSEAPQNEENHNDTEESLNDFHEVTITNDKQYESRPSFSETMAYKHMPPINSKPIQYFNLFFTDEFLETMKIETNRYARWFYEKFELLDLPPELTWYDTTIPELRAFFAVLLEMGITWRSTIRSYWTKNYRHIPWFEQMLGEMRFRLLCRFFHTLDRNTLPAQDSNEYHPGLKYEPVLAHANKTFKYYYSPDQHLSIDGSLLGPKTKSTVTRLLMDDSYKKSYAKFWMLNDAKSQYCLSIYGHHSNYNHSDKEEIKKTDLRYFIIHKLMNMGDYLMKGYHVVASKFFTSITLAKSLFKEHTFLTGRMHSNAKYIPPQLKQELNVGEYKYFRNREILLLAYKERKSKRRNMILLSTYGTAANRTTIIQKQEEQVEVVKPVIVDDYIKFMDAHNISSIMSYPFSDKKKIYKFWRKVVFSIFSRMVWNAYILYQKNITEERSLNLSEFIITIIQSLTKEWMTEKKMSPERSLGEASSDTTDPGIRKLPEKRRKVCVVCSKADDESVQKSRTVCNHCNNGLHDVCISKHQC